MSVAVAERQAVETRPHPETGAPETQQERDQRIMADETLIDMKGVAAFIGRKHQWVRDLNSQRNRWQTIVEKGIVLPRKGRKEPERPATPREIAEAKAHLVDALPTPDDKFGQSPVWKRNKIARWAGQADMTDAWHEPIPKAPPGKAREIVMDDVEQ